MTGKTPSWKTAPGLMRTIGGLALCLVGVALALIVLVLALLQIAPLRQSVLTFVLDEINTGETHISIGDIAGEWPRRLTLSKLEVADAQGVWLSLEEARLEWSPLALLKGELHILSLDAADIAVSRAPASNAPSEESQSFAFPSLPIAVRIDAARVSGLSLSRRLVEPGEKGLLVKLNLEARAALNRSRVELALKGSRVDNDASGKVDLQALFDNRDKRIALTLDAVDGANGKPGLAALLGGLDADRVAIAARAEGLNGKVDASAKIDGGNTVMLDAGAKGQWDRELDLDVTAKASGRLVETVLADIGRPHDLDLAGKIRWTRDDTLSVAGLTLKTGALALTGEARLGTASVSAPHAFEAQGTLDGLDHVLGYPGNTALAAFTWRTAATLDLRANTARVSQAVVTAPPGTATFAGDAKLDGSAAKGALHLAMNDIAPLGQIIGQKMSGRAEIDLTPVALEPGGSVAGDFIIRAEAVDMDDPVLTRLFHAFTADGSLLLPKAGGFALPSLTVTPLSGDYAFKGTVAASPADILSGEAHFTTRNVAVLLPGGEASGALDAKATFIGTLNAPGVTLAAKLSDGALAGTPARLVTLDATALQGGSGPLVFRFNGAPGKASVDAQLSLPREGGARLDAIAADLFGSKLAGSAALDKNALITASLKSERLALKPFADLAGVPLDGTGALTLTLTAAPVNGKQNATLAFAATRLDVDLPTPIALDRATLDAALTDLFGKAQADAKFAAASGQAGLTHLESVTASARGPLTNLALSAAAKGTRETFNPEPFSLAADAVYAKTLTVSRLDVAVGKATLALAKPLTLALANGVEAKNFALALEGASGAGQLKGDFALRQTVRLHLEAADAPLDLASLLLPVETIKGRMNGSADLDTARNTGALSFRFDSILLDQGDTNERPPFNASLNGTWAKGRFDLDAEAQGVSTRPFTLAASIPVTRPAGSAWPALASRGAVTGSLTWDGPLASLAAFVDIGNQRIGGGTHVALSADGDISAPRISGTATVADGYYENTDTGTILKNISAKLEGSQSQSLAFTLEGTDGGKGKIAAQGRVALAKGAFPAISISTSFTNARLVRRADVDATADGQIELIGPTFPPGPDAPLTLKGSVTTRALQIRIPERLPSSVARIDVVEINGQSTKRAVAAEEAPAIPIELDIKVATGTPARISGRGLDSLWNGDLAVTGTAGRPLISGRLDSERGTLDFAGKTFTLSKGEVRFPGAYPIDPDFDVTLAYARSDLKATIDLTGQASAPQMTLSSTPTLPQDEILSRILFNKGVGELSAMEAVQLAQTLAELSGTNFGGGGLGVLDRLQQTLSLDVLRIDSAQSGATTLSAGKYIQKGVYVGVEQGALASDSSVKVEIEVTPQISVDTRIGQNASGDVGVNWKWDY